MNKISNAGGIALKNGLEKNGKITSFSLRSNDMKNRAGIEFKSLSDVKTNILKLDITLNGIRQIYIDDIEANLKRNFEMNQEQTTEKLKAELRHLNKNFSPTYYPKTIDDIED